MKFVATHEAKTHLSALLQEVIHGETIVISRGKKRLAKLIPYDEPVARPRAGEVIDAPFSLPDEALRPLIRDEINFGGCDASIAGYLHVSVAGV